MTPADLRDLRVFVAEAQARLDDFSQALERNQEERARLCADSLVPCLSQLADEADDLIPELKKAAHRRRTRR